MLYKTELHCHSKPVSPCSDATPEEIVRQYLEFGYTTVVITDHLSEYTLNFSGEAEPRAAMEYFLSGYRAVKACAGDRLNVLLGAEIRFPGTGGTDYLIYGPSEDFFLSNPDMHLHDRYWTGSLVHNNGCLFYQAHPFRFNMMLCEDYVIDGIEVYNGHPGQNSHNRMAQEWLRELPGLKGISGSDHHGISQYPDAGILTEVPVRDNKQLVQILKSGNYQLICDEETRQRSIREAR